MRPHAGPNDLFAQLRAFLRLSPTADASLRLELINAASGNYPIVRPWGPDADIDLRLFGKGTGKVYVNGGVAEDQNNRGIASGYAALDSGVLVPAAQLGTGTPSASTFLRGDRAWTPFGAMALADNPLQTGRLIEVIKEQGTTTLLYVGVGTATEVNPGISADGNTFAVKRYLTTAVANDFAGVITPAVARIGYDGDFLLVGSVGNTITSYGLWFALTSATLGNVATPTTQHVAGFRYDTTVDGTAFWRCVTCNGASGVTTTTTSAAVNASTFYTFRIVASGDGTSVAFYIDNALVATHTTNLPGLTTNLSMQQVCTTYSAATRRTEFSRFGALIP